jgi:hypothetical protein
MALTHGHSDFRVALEAANAGAMAGAWIDNNDRRFVRIDAVVPAMPVDFRDAQQCRSGGNPARSCSSMLFARWRSVSQNRMARSKKSRW